MHGILSIRSIWKDGIMAGKDGTQKLGKLVETGLSVARMAQTKAEEALRDVAHISEAQRNQMQKMLDDAAKKSRDSTEALIKGLRKEMEKQMRTANALSKEEFGKFSEKLSSLSQDLGKMSSIREEVAKLSEMVNSLVRSVSSSETLGGASGEKAASAGGEKAKPTTARRAPRTTTARTRRSTRKVTPSTTTAPAADAAVAEPAGDASAPPEGEGTPNA